MKIILYTTGCPKCSVLKKKLDMLHIEYETCEDTDIMLSKGLKKAPALEIDGRILDYKEAINFIKEKEVEQ